MVTPICGKCERRNGMAEEPAGRVHGFRGREFTDIGGVAYFGCGVAHGYWKVRGPSGAGLSEDAAFVTRRNEELANSTKKGLRSGGTEASVTGYARSSLRGSTAPLVSEPYGRLCGSKHN
jgi:hypothetical protein